MIDVREQRARLDVWASGAKQRAGALQVAAQAAAQEVRKLQDTSAEGGVIGLAAERASRAFDDAARACREAAAASEALAAAQTSDTTPARAS